jgi:hypothetical protein
MNLETKIQAVLLLVLILAAIAICGGACGPSDLELRKRASEPTTLQQ